MGKWRRLGIDSIMGTPVVLLVADPAFAISSDEIIICEHSWQLLYGKVLLRKLKRGSDEIPESYRKFLWRHKCDLAVIGDARHC